MVEHANESYFVRLAWYVYTRFIERSCNTIQKGTKMIWNITVKKLFELLYFILMSFYYICVIVEVDDSEGWHNKVIFEIEIMVELDHHRFHNKSLMRTNPLEKTDLIYYYKCTKPKVWTLKISILWWYRSYTLWVSRFLQLKKNPKSENVTLLFMKKTWIYWPSQQRTQVGIDNSSV